jgi:hypothetical protein
VPTEQVATLVRSTPYLVFTLYIYVDDGSEEEYDTSLSLSVLSSIKKNHLPNHSFSGRRSFVPGTGMQLFRPGEDPLALSVDFLATENPR